MKKSFKKYSKQIAWICGILAVTFGIVGLGYDNLVGFLLFWVFVIPGAYSFVVYGRKVEGR